MKQYIPNPNKSEIYGIYKTCLDELIRSKLVTHTEASDPPDPEADATILQTPFLGREKDELPDRLEMSVDWGTIPNSPCRKLWRISQKSEVSWHLISLLLERIHSIL